MVASYTKGLDFYTIYTNYLHSLSACTLFLHTSFVFDVGMRYTIIHNVLPSTLISSFRKRQQNLVMFHFFSRIFMPCFRTRKISYC